MSTYTVGEIVVWLLLAAALGFILGWLTRELRLRRGHPTAEPPAPRRQEQSAATGPAEEAAAEKAPAKKTPAKKTSARRTPAKKTHGSTGSDTA